MVPSRLPSPSYVRVASLFLAMIALLAMPFYSQAQTRPAITGISHMCVYASDAEASDNFYGHILGAAKGADPQDGSGVRYYFGPEQFVEVLPLPAEHTLSRISCVAFSTVDAKGLHRYMEAHHTEALGAVRDCERRDRVVQVA